MPLDYTPPAVENSVLSGAPIGERDRTCPPLDGVASFEWDVVNGTTRYSDEWRSITKNDDYDWTRPNNEEWWNKRVHPHDMPVLQRTCLAIIAGFVDRAHTVYRLLRDDGVWRTIHARSRVTRRAEDGSPLVVNGICIDITNTVVEPGGYPGASSVSDFDYHAMLENSPDLFIRLTEDMKPVYVNPVIMRYLGRRPEDEALNDTPANLDIMGDYKEVLTRNVGRVFTERTASRESLSFTLPDGRDIYGECSFWPEYDSGGKVRYAMVQFRDYTEKQRLQRSMEINKRRQEALYRLTFMEGDSEQDVLRFVMESVLQLTNSRSGFIYFPETSGSEKGYLYWSTDHYAFLDPEHLPNDRLPQDLVIQISDEEGRPRHRSINNGDGKTPLYVVFDGRMKVMRGITTPVTEENSVVCIAGVCNKDTDYDESDLQQLETFVNSAWLILRRRRFVSELQKAKEAAETANRAKNAFLANVSHELRTPLNGVLSMLQLIETLPMSDEQREYLHTAQYSGSALMRIIADLLDFSCMEAGKMPLSVELFDCREALRSALRVLQEEARKRRLDFGYHISQDIPRYLWGDGHRLRQIVFNLVGNALKYTSEGGIKVACERIEGSPQGRAGLSLTVRDTGVGIPPDKLAVIFDAFTQIENANRGKYPGTGLGLSIVRHLVSMMDGTLCVQSDPGVGTTFTCTMFFDMHAAATGSGTGYNGEEEAAIRPLDILVAEDDEVGRFAIRSFLQKGGHRVVCVADGKQALEALQLHPFHCLFTDIAMPYVDGLELVRLIRSGQAEDYPPSGEVCALVRDVFPKSNCSPLLLQKDITIVAVTAHTMIGDRERFLGQGINHYVSKPIIRKELDEALRYAARRLEDL